jgi:hypothetical protein
MAHTHGDADGASYRGSAGMSHVLQRTLCRSIRLALELTIQNRNSKCFIKKQQKQQRENPRDNKQGTGEQKRTRARSWLAAFWWQGHVVFYFMYSAHYTCIVIVT